jgi:ubiquinol-cytochrome c reductase cytochrome c subunit
MRRLAVIVGLAFVVTTAAAGAQAPTPVQQGKNLYGRYCVMCHGPNGSGIHTATRVGGGPLRDQTVTRGMGPSLRGVGAEAADFYLRTGYMPLRSPSIQPTRSRVLFSETQIRALVAYVASLGHGPAIPTPHPSRGSVADGRRLFTERCAGCHQVVAEGGFVTGARVPPLEDATPVQIAQAVRIGPYVMPTFSKRSISDSQLDSIIRYVQFAKHPDDRGGWSIGHIGPVPEGIVTWWVGGVVLVAFCVLLGKRLRA